MKNKHYLWLLGILLILLMPIILNFLLRQRTPIDVNVISDPNSGPGIWLVFWGSYLAAIGSFAMALVAYIQNKQTQETNDKHFMFEVKYRQYEQLEKFVKYACYLHSASYFNAIIRIAEQNPTEAIERCERYLFDLVFFSSSICHYKNLFQDKEMENFGNKLAQTNVIFMKDVHELINILNTNPQEQLSKIRNCKKDAIEITNLQEYGHELISKKWDFLKNQN